MTNANGQASDCGNPRSDAVQAHSLRVTLARELGHEIDGAWWPRTGYISGELSELMALPDTQLGKIIQINANWSSLRRPPDLNWLGWHHKRQNIATISGCNAQANLLIVPHSTNIHPGDRGVASSRRSADQPHPPRQRAVLRSQLRPECYPTAARLADRGLIIGEGHESRSDSNTDKDR